MSARVNVGNATIIGLSDAIERASAAEVYVGRSAEELARYSDYLVEGGDFVLNFGCYAIRVDGKTILVDTGWGPSHNGTLLAEMDDAGLKPEEVDVVTFTHLHIDHIGWNMIVENGSARPRFPNARYLIPEFDWRYFSDKAGMADRQEEASMFSEQVLPLESHGVVDFIGGDHAITSSVTSLHTPGHTPGHLSFVVQSGGERGIVLGDVAFTEIDMVELDWKTTWDEDQDLAVATRHRIIEQLENDGSLVAASHFPNPGLGRFVRAEGRRYWQPVG